MDKILVDAFALQRVLLAFYGREDQIMGMLPVVMQSEPNPIEILKREYNAQQNAHAALHGAR